MPSRPSMILTPDSFQSPVAITRSQMIYTSRDTLRAVLFEYRDAIRPAGDWIGLLGLVVSLWALYGVVAQAGWRGVLATMACLAGLYLLINFVSWVRRGCPDIGSVVDRLIADSDQGYASETVRGQLEVHHVTPAPGRPPRRTGRRKKRDLK